MYYECQQCGKIVYEKYGSGRFCSRSCSNKYVALHQSDEAKAKKVEAGKKNLELGWYSNGRNFTDKERIRGKNTRIIKAKNKRRFWIAKVLLNEIDPYSCGYTRFRLALIEFGYKKHRCECCGLEEWQGQKIPLEVHHDDGDHKNNRLENIKLLCPNCHALTDNYKFRGAKKK